MKDWQLELDDLSQLDNAGVPAQPIKNGEGNGEGVTVRKNADVQRTESTIDGSRISSGTSTVPGAADQPYASSEAATTVPV